MTIQKARARFAVVLAGAVILLIALSGNGDTWVGALQDQGVERTGGMVRAPETATVACTFKQGADDVALVGGPGGMVSASGWWEEGNCPALPADVSVRLQAEHDGNWWDIVWSATATMAPGDRAEANFRCPDAKATKWRSVVEVDLFERPDGSGELITPPQRLPCRPDVTALHR